MPSLVEILTTLVTSTGALPFAGSADGAMVALASMNSLPTCRRRASAVPAAAKADRLAIAVPMSSALSSSRQEASGPVLPAALLPAQPFLTDSSATVLFPLAARTAKLPRVPRESSRGRPDSASPDSDRRAPAMLRHPRARARRRRAVPDRPRHPRHRRRRQAQPDLARRSRHPLLAGQRGPARALRRIGAVRDPPARPGRRASTARARSWSAPCASDPEVTTLSPWDRGSVERLRPSPRRALIVIDFHVGLADSVNDSVDELDRHPRRADPPAGPRDPDRLRDASRGRSRTSRSTPPSAAS